MSAPDLDQTVNMTLLQPYLVALSAALRKGFDRYQNDYPPRVRADHDSAAAAMCIHRHVIAELTSDVEAIAGVNMVRARGLHAVNLHDRAVLRIKKMNDEGRSVSYPTPQARDFDRQLPLPFVPPAATRLTFGYEPDLAFSAIVRILVSCPLGPSIHWCAQIHDEDESVASWTDITPKRLTGTEPFRPYAVGDA